MNTYIRDIRYKLQNRVNRLRTSDAQTFHQELQRFFSFLSSDEFLSSITEEVCSLHPSVKQEVAALQPGSGGFVYGKTDAENAAAGYLVLKRVHDEPGPQGISFFEFSTSHELDPQPFCAQYLNPFYEYVDEQLEDRNTVLGLLLKYKHLAEWFRRGELFQLWRDNSGRGEKTLALKVYEYLFQEGVEFSIEPWSVSGEADMVSSQTSSNRLVADIKIFAPDAGKGAPYIRSGFAQVLTYTRDYNTPMGYLVVFNVSGKQLRINTQRPSNPVPRVVLSNRTIWLVEIDISPYESSASKRGTPEVITIGEDELLREVDDSGASA